MQRSSWEDLLDDRSSSAGPSSFIFTAESLKAFIRQHCEDPREATQSILAYAECIPQSSYESSRATIPRHRPKSLAFPFLDLPPELIILVAKKIPIELKYQYTLGSLSMVSKSVRELIFPLLFSSLELSSSKFVTQRSGFWENHPGLRESHLKELRISLSGAASLLQEVCNVVGRLSQNGWKNRIRHISISSFFWVPHHEGSEEQKYLANLGQILKDFDQLTSLEVNFPNYEFAQDLFQYYPKTLVYLKMPYFDDTVADVLSKLPSLRIFEYSGPCHSLKTSPNWRFGIQELRVHSSDDFATLITVLKASSGTLKSLVLSHFHFPDFDFDNQADLDLPQMHHLSYIWFNGVSGPANVFFSSLNTRSKNLRCLRLWMDEPDEESEPQDIFSQDLLQDILHSRNDVTWCSCLDAIFFNETAWSCMVENWWMGDNEFVHLFKVVGITVVED